jgi:GNAT superfamily N-acetyltransferase
VTSELEIRPYQSGDRKHILSLFRQSYGRGLDECLWAWRFRNGPAGAGVIYLCWDRNILAAHYAVTPVVMRINDQNWPTGLSGTTMTHPDYRGRGLFPRLARRTYTYMAESGMGLVWGFPNTLSHRGFVRNLSWVDIYEVPTFRLPLQEPPSLSTPGDAVLELKGFDARFDRLWNQVKDDYPIIARRDQQYLQWRYAENPAEHYRILAHVEDETLLGYAVFKRYQNELQIVDVLTVQDTDVGLALVSRAAQIALEEPAASVSLWLNVTHPLHHALEKRGFRNGEPVTYFGGLALQPDLPAVDLYDFRNWYLTMGDSDVF